MRYYLTTQDLIYRLYFCQNHEEGFTLSTSEEDALIVKGREEALKAAKKLQEQSGMQVEIKKVV